MIAAQRLLVTIFRLVPVFVQADEPRPRGRQAASYDLAEQQARAYFRAMGRDLTVA